MYLRFRVCVLSHCVCKLDCADPWDGLDLPGHQRSLMQQLTIWVHRVLCRVLCKVCAHCGRLLQHLPVRHVLTDAALCWLGGVLRQKHGPCLWQQRIVVPLIYRAECLSSNDTFLHFNRLYNLNLHFRLILYNNNLLLFSQEHNGTQLVLK